MNRADDHVRALATDFCRRASVVKVGTVGENDLSRLSPNCGRNRGGDGEEDPHAGCRGGRFTEEYNHNG